VEKPLKEELKAKKMEKIFLHKYTFIILNNLYILKSINKYKNNYYILY